MISRGSLRATDIRVIGALLGQLDIAAATSEEAKGAFDLLPPLYSDNRLQGSIAAVSKHIEAKLAAGFTLESPEVILVRKARRGMRPVHVLGLEARVLYRALVSRLSASVQPNDRALDYASFRAAPLNSSGATHVVLSDVHAFYQYIDHGILAQEIIDQTGEVELALTMVGLLGAIGGRGFGIPQGLSASSLIGELYIDVAERRLLRRGLAVARYVDDFAISTPSAAAAGRALEALEDDLRSIGLTLNEEKTRTRTLVQYGEWVSSAERYWQELEGSVAEALRDFDPYQGSEPEPDEQDVTVAAASSYLASWAASAGRDELYGYRASAQRQLLRKSFSALTFFDSDAGLDHAEMALLEEPNLTPSICGYLRSQTGKDAARVSSIVDAIIGADDFVSPWQSLWLLEVMKGYRPFSTDQAAWARKLALGTGVGALAAAATIPLAQNGMISDRQLGELYGQVPAASRATVAFALSLIDPGASSPITTATIAESPINRAVMTEPDDTF